MMRHAQEHCMLKALPACHHKHTSLVSTFVHGVLEGCAERVDQELPFSLSNYVHYLAVLERLGIQHGTSRAVCAKAWLFQCLDMSTQALCPMLCMCVVSM
jgi:hypothetical protein